MSSFDVSGARSVVLCASAGQNMPLGSLSKQSSASQTALAERFCQTRALTTALIAPLAAEDCVVQSMPDASPAKWHLAHTTWFFEQFVLGPHAPGYREFDARFGYLFNSYYETVGDRHRRADRGLLTRPTLEEVRAYRDYVDEGVSDLLAGGTPSRRRGADRARPASRAAAPGTAPDRPEASPVLQSVASHLSASSRVRSLRTTVEPLLFYQCPEGIYEIGHSGSAFSFDNETPRHRVFLAPFALAHRPISNAEYRDFIRDGGYTKAQLWMSDGWATVQAQGWKRPIYWNEALDGEFTLGGERELEPAAPVCHVSCYEADAFARWAGARLPTEAEWEVVAARQPIDGNFLDDDLLHPLRDGAGPRLTQLFGDVWEWTSSPYSPYPGFRPPPARSANTTASSWRTSSCCAAVPASRRHAHPREVPQLLLPHARWQFAGIRLAKGSA